MRVFSLFLGLFAIAACGSDGPRSPPIGENAKQSAESGQNYRLGIGDKVRVTVLGQTDLSGESEVDAGGKIVVAMAGAVDAAGSTVLEVSERVKTAFAGRILRDPKVAVQVTEYRPITVTGEVKSPGRYRFAFGMDVRAAIAMGGGYDKRANQKTVIVYRNNQPYEATAESMLAPGDTVEVARR